MITSIINKKIGKFTTFALYQNPIHYGYKVTSTNSGIKMKTDRDLRAEYVKRAKSKMLNLIKGNLYEHKEKPVFLTLTFADNLTDIKKANYEFKKFILRFNYKLGFKVRYMAVPEFQERGAVHYHLIVFNLPFTSGAWIEKEVWKGGGTDISLVNRQFGSFNYITKYFTKTFSDSRFNKNKKFFYSLVNKEIKNLSEKDNVNYYNSIYQSAELVYDKTFIVADNKGRTINEITRKDYLLT